MRHQTGSRLLRGFLTLPLGRLLLIWGLICVQLTSCSTEPQISWYRGEIRMFLPDSAGEAGRAIGSYPAWVRRTLEPHKHQIIEDVLTRQAGKAAETYRVLFALNPDETSFSLSETSGLFKGKGRLIGSKWAWRAWESESLMPNGMRVVSKDQIEADGHLKVAKQIYQQDKLVVLMTEDYTPIPETEYAAALAAAKP